ncbi:MAG: hypothetical protein QM572_07315 [Nocardioides sp.]|uniref:hypothetical protein n=1 Tax=Nocardioides sp. TaxID=35761 RepID=UPI0039E6C09B
MTAAEIEALAVLVHQTDPGVQHRQAVSEWEDRYWAGLEPEPVGDEWGPEPPPPEEFQTGMDRRWALSKGIGRTISRRDPMEGRELIERLLNNPERGIVRLATANIGRYVVTAYWHYHKQDADYEGTAFLGPDDIDLWVRAVTHPENDGDSPGVSHGDMEELQRLLPDYVFASMVSALAAQFAEARRRGHGKFQQ